MPIWVQVGTRVVTAIFGLSERLYATELGAADYITRPFQMEELLSRVHDQLPPAQPLPAKP